MQDKNSSKCESVMKDEMDSLLGNQTWELIELPIRKKALYNKRVYQVKTKHCNNKRHSAILVVKVLTTLRFFFSSGENQDYQTCAKNGGYRNFTS